MPFTSHANFPVPKSIRGENILEPYLLYEHLAFLKIFLQFEFIDRIWILMLDYSHTRETVKCESWQNIYEICKRFIQPEVVPTPSQ